MTAVIGILNKSGIALAADSAVTISSNKKEKRERKIYNNAYKIFALSKFQPVSLMLYNSASFNGVPWEILVKKYRKELGKKKYDHLEQYHKDFFRFLNENINLVSKENQELSIELFINFVFKTIIKDATKNKLEVIEKAKTKKSKIETLIAEIKVLINNVLENHKDNETLDAFEGYTYRDFTNEYKVFLNKHFNQKYKELDIGETYKTKLFKVVYTLMIHDGFYGNWTGLVFTGYGEQEIYPSCIPFKVGEVFNNKIRYIIEKKKCATINDFITGAIRPFAQTDVIDTILSGIDTNLEKTIYKSFEDFLTNFVKHLSDIIEKDDDDLAKKIETINIPELIKGFANKFNEIKKKLHIHPLMSTIGTLSKEDLAELSESLIYLTYLKRRMSFSEESVGGPIDVAIITKGDGLIWIKRKHYFDINLNPDFIQKYLNY